MEQERIDPEIAIIGGGICGLTTALALEQRGFAPTVYEAASRYRPVGAGLLLQTNALLVYDHLGLANRIQSAGVSLTESQIRSPSGTVLKEFDLDELERAEFGFGFVAIHRAELQSILLDELQTDVQTGKVCDAVTSTEPPIVLFEDNSTIQPDILIGTDGINSRVRKAIAPHVECRNLGGIVYRAVTAPEIGADHQARGFEIWGDGHYTGGAPLSDETFYWFATAPNERHDDPPASVDLLSTLRDRYSEHPAPIPSIIDSLESDDIITSSLIDLPTLERWHQDSVVLAGDAAHGMLPFAGQGAAQAIEDALTLAHSLTTERDPPEAFTAYTAARKPRADRIRVESRRLGELGTLQSTFGSRLRNFALRLVPKTAFEYSRRQRAAKTSLPDSPSSQEAEGLN